jgi:CRISPR-associated endonuclease/helicase Cas3
VFPTVPVILDRLKTWEGVTIICSCHVAKYEDVLWAKKSDRAGALQWLPLKQHLVDAAEVMHLLWEHWLSPRQRLEIIKSLRSPSEQLARQLVRFLGAVHDLGKATPVFQSRPSHFSSRDLDWELLEKLEKVGFVGITKFYDSLMNPSASPHALAGQALLESYGVSQDISSIVGAHHGIPAVNEREVSPQLSSYTKNYFQDHDRTSFVHRKWHETQRGIFEWSLALSGFRSVEELPEVSQPGQVLLSGLLIMADWIASNERYFPLISLDQAEIEDHEKRIETGWLEWYRTAPRIEEEHIDSESGYRIRFDFAPRDFQAKFFQVIRQTAHPGIFIVEAPMGEGKTEAALIGVEQLSAKTQASGMFFGLPTQATSDGIFVRIKKWLEKLDDERKSLQLVHGKAALNETYTSLPRSNVYDETDGSVVVNEWFTGRKTAVLDDFVVGTVDQFLMTALKQKHLALRHLGFSKKVIVIDEVHAFDAYMSQYLYRALRWMGAYNVPVLILSATLPAKTRVKLIENYMYGAGRKWRDVTGPEGWETTTAYPLITYTDGMAVNQFCDFATTRNTKVTIVCLAEEDLISTLAEQLQDGGIAGIIVNTVRRAQEIARVCSAHFGEQVVELLHSNFIATHRIEKEQELLSLIGKGAERPEKKIIVGTQVMEQSLDIDFDLLVSDLAPMDLLLQRIGRLHRHHKVTRPKLLAKPKLFVLGTSETFEFEQGSSFIYGDYLLMRTQLLLPDVLCLPNHISQLVQGVYGDHDLPVEPALQEKYYSAKEEHKSKIARKKDRARGYLLGKPRFSNGESLNGWLVSELKYDSEERAAAQVRDTEETIGVIALKKHGDGYTLFGEERDLSLNVDNQAVQKEIARQTLRLPLPLSAPYCIDQTIYELEEFNRRHLPSWQHSDWLRGLLGIIFDEKNEFILNGYRLKYCSKWGLTYEKLQVVEEGSN